MNKAEAMAAHTGGAPFTRVQSSELHSRVTGDLAVVTGRLQRTRTVEGRAAADDRRFRKVYRRDASGWRVISYHAWETPR